MTKLLDNKIALITGASRGIGAAVAKRYASQGAHVVLVGRTMGALEEVDDAIQAEGGTATIMQLDLKKFDRIDPIGGILLEKFGGLDIFVGNAAILGDLTPVSHLSPKIWEDIMAVNVTANFRMIRTLDPLLRQSEAGRALFVTSGVTQANFPFWGAYAASKVALEQMVKTYAAETKNSHLCVNLIDPGVVRTKMRATAMPGEDPATLPAPEDITDIFLELAQYECNASGQRLEVRL